MDKLIVCYSRTGYTRKLAKIISEKLNCDYEEILDLKNRSGMIGFIRGGYDALKKKETDISRLDKKISDYEMIIIGTPVWAGTITPAIRTLLLKSKDKIKNAAFFCTNGGGDCDKTFQELKNLSEEPIATFCCTDEEIKENEFEERLNEFITKIDI